MDAARGARGSGGERALVGVGVLAVGALVVLPLLRLGWVAAGDGGASIARVLRSPGLGTAAAHSLELAVIVPLLAVPLGAAAALVLRHPDVPFRRLLRALVVLPLLVPQFILGYSWTQAYGPAGFSQQTVGLHWAGLQGPAGIVVVLVADAAPLSYLLTTAGLATRAQPELEAAARTSGASGWVALRSVTLPLLRPVLAAAAVLIFVGTLESFAAPQVLGTPAGYATLTTRLYADLALGSDPASFQDALTLALVLVVLAALILVPADVVLAPRLETIRTTAPGATRVLGGHRSRRTPALLAVLLGGYTMLVVIVPTLALVLAAITRAIGLPPTPGNWTLANFRGALDAPTRSALLHSLQLALAAGAVLTVLGAAVAALRHRRSGRLLGSATMLTFAVPGSALAVGLLIAYDRVLGGSLLLILLAYLAKFWALAHRTVSGAVDRLPAGEWQAARTSGAAPLAAVRTVWLPAMAPALLGAWVLVFLAAMHEVTMSSLLYSSGSETFSVAVLNSQELGDTATTAALSVTLTAVLVAVAMMAWALLRLDARRHRAPAGSTTATLEVAGAH